MLWKFILNQWLCWNDYERKRLLEIRYLFNIFEIKRNLPNFVEFIDENYLKELSKRLEGTLIFIGGTTEFEVPAFMRSKYLMNEKEIFLIFLFPSAFKTYEVIVDSDKIEARIFYKQKKDGNYFYYERHLRADGIEEIASYPLEDI
ncbi:MAG: hypothetical protein N3G19_00810 [Candidatus Pacearchaeota archaeon]|nr:hypothetical protein [Candidatus Pacearchaeota archaeon]